MTLREWISWIFNPPMPIPTPTPQPSPMASELLIAHNTIRSNSKLPPLTHSTILDSVAESLTIVMARLKTMSHEADGYTMQQRLAQEKYSYKFAGENIAYNYATISAVMTAWMDSPSHRINILNPTFTEMGCGLSYSKDGQPYWACDFGTPTNHVSLSGPLEP